MTTGPEMEHTTTTSLITDTAPDYTMEQSTTSTDFSEAVAVPVTLLLAVAGGCGDGCCAHPVCSITD